MKTQKRKLTPTGKSSVLPVPDAIKPAFRYPNEIEWCPDLPGCFAYVLMCANGHLYKGYTEHFRKRMLAHFNGCGCSTTKRLKPAYIYHYELCADRTAAKERERFFKLTAGYIFLKDPENLIQLKP